MGFAIELYFDPQTERILLDLRKTLTAAGVKPVLDEIGDRPHISLAVFSQIDPDQLLDELKEFAGELSQMPITLSAVGSFPTAEAVLFLAPAITQELLDVHWDAHQILADLKLHAHAYYLPDRWVPHCTMAQNIQPDLVPTAFDVLRKSFKPISGKLAQIGLVRFRPVESLGLFTLAGT